MAPRGVPSFRSLRLLPLLITVLYAAPVPDAEILNMIAEGKIGKASNISCVFTPPEVEIEWFFNKNPLDTNDTRFKIENEKGTLEDGSGYYRRVSLIISDTKSSDHGVYGCQISESELSEKRFLNLSLPTRIVSQTGSPIRVNISDSVRLFCTYEGFNLTEVKWRLQANHAKSNVSLIKLQLPEKNFQNIKINETHINGTMRIDRVAKTDNGTYNCGVREFSKKVITTSINLLVLDKPQISLDVVKAVDSTRIFLNWTVNDGNLPIETNTLQYMEEGSESWRYYESPIKGSNVSFVMKGLKPSTSYKLKITAKNAFGDGSYVEHEWVTTLKEDPKFRPNVIIKGFTTTSLTIAWNGPPENISEYVHYYEILAKEKDRPSGSGIETVHWGNSRNNPYLFDNLKAATVYIFEVRACSEYTLECGEWSVPVNGSTMDGISEPPIINGLTCKNDNISGTNFVYVSWDPPSVPNGQIIRYNVEVIGNASFMNNQGQMETQTWGPKMKYITYSIQNARFDSMPANTNFTIKVIAVTRIRMLGEPAVAHCTTPPSLPPRDSLIGIRWDKVREGDSWLIKLNIPRVTERNGVICCYRVFIVRMKNQQRLNDMPSPEHLYISSYKKVHNGKESAGAYIAEIFTSKNLETNVILGDGITYGTYSTDSLQQCSRCASVLSKKTHLNTTIATPVTTTHPFTTVEKKLSPNPSDDIIETSTFKIDMETTTMILDKNINVTSPIETAALNKEVMPHAEKLESNKYHHAKKKKKTKRQDLVHGSKSQEEPLSERYNMEFSNDDVVSVRDFNSNLNDDRKFILDNDYYANQRIYHQNKIRPYIANYPPDTEIIGNEDLSEMEEDDSIISSPDDIALQVANNEPSENEKLLRRHKIVLRQVNQEDFDKSEPTELKQNFEVVEEIVDINKVKESINEEELPIYDGELDLESNYTGFLELLVHSGQEEKMVPMYSDYFNVLKPGPNPVPDSENAYLKTAIMIIVIGLMVVIIILCIVFCVIHSNNYRKARQHGGPETHPLQHTIRNIYHGFKSGRHQLVSQNPPNMLPIQKDKLLTAYTEKQVDSGYEFQREFELLPDCFSDRTTDASEAKENQGKNRYPDIKAYDQTRVKLSQIDSVVGSDYINANFVLGYKERKKFICAQGPTDVTVDDFWRMIWENNLELLVMLTNLEEYSKVKCTKYWPDQHQQDKLFNNINVHYVSEKRYSDYIIRELKITKQSLSQSHSSNQLIEANGIAKKNGGINECNNSNGSASGASEERIVHQYHFLMWKDFVAPEYPHAILKFIKRMNEASAAGRPILVHCSAGVGRTGTLVALDCLLEQMSAEGQVSIFNTICDLRRQRNFLVQSLKQYIFVYRALVEHAQYNDSEISAAQLKSTVDMLRQTAENSDTCLMEEEFERLKQPFLETTKPCAAARAPENLSKNRNEGVIPYDHNRVILAPLPAKDNSTYINATFIEGYDNAESYIIAQDPLPQTIPDFWRMVLEQEINTIVMLSELGEGKCPRYWDDDEIQYDHINVTYLLSESCPYYTRREFQVTNTKNQERIKVTQLQYHGWPTVSGQVPEVTRGIIELVGQSGASSPSTTPILVHCSQGTDRSSMFVALSILTIQLRTEKRVDVSTVTRKLRSQRMGCLDTFLQYEFLHRAIVNYAELHNLLSDS